MPHEALENGSALVEKRDEKKKTVESANNSSRHRGPESEVAVKSALRAKQTDIPSLT